MKSGDKPPHNAAIPGSGAQSKKPVSVIVGGSAAQHRFKL
ncbi:hypothetical protein HMPREF0454_01042 [Hafnia alvei ATCC 51873]|uniref:Uncharacterized protein n=1 Tax=Hafnia alvei ATCC 51873 TaxID=1002364 RepID=G9Y3F7_HAFAL|nr:hypothetical protein HMPREF0454_01042 [Hafnia alvei ATCC 51873]